MKDDQLREIVLVAVFGTVAFAIMALRLVMRKVRRQPFNLSDYITIVAILCTILRSIFTTIVILWMNNNYSGSPVFTATDIYQRGVGSKLTLVNRVVFNAYIWLQKSVVMLLYKRMLDGLTIPSQILKVYWVILGVTFTVVQVLTFTECRPVSLYWQVVPNPGDCTKAPIQLISYVSLNIATDLMLIILPIPLLLKIKRSLKQRLQLIALFSIGFLLIAIAFVRLPINWGSLGTSQVNRNTWGSVELFAAALVANIPTLFTLRRAESPNTSLPTSHSQRYTGTGGLRGFRTVSERGITVTNSIELKHETVADFKDPLEFREIWDMYKQASNDNLVHVVHIDE